MRRSQNISRRDFLKASAASVGLVGLGVSAAHGASQTVRTGGVLRYAHNTDILNFDPTQLPAGNFAMLYTLYDTLIRFDEKYKATPQLAESWEFGDGGKRLTMRLRKGVTFHTGREFSADDVVFTLQRFQDKEVAANLRPMSLYIKDAKADDKHTVSFNMEKPNAALLDFLDSMFIMDKETVKDVKTKGVGTGPFKLIRWIPGDRIIWEKNKNYWKEGKPYLDGIEMLAIPDYSALSINVEAGAIDIAERLAPSDLKRLQGNPSLEVLITAFGNQWNDILFNTKRPPFDNPKVRAAIDLAVDRKRFADIYYAGFSKPACLPYPEFSPGYFEDQAKRCEFNLDKAKKLLNEPGISNLDVTMTVSAPGYYPGSDVLAQVMNADLRKIGVNLKIENLPQAQARPKILMARDYQLAGHIYGRANKDPVTMFAGAVA
ncbi:MAG TPA: ABC transporter substrate-binding protein [Candidatus Acidoferrum sp.]|nr:ABC transporter substrate-binding protein [Candidatus Acidoferrum sp.]